MATWYELNVKLLEDLHTGTGMGRGDVDAVQAMDRHGRPVIRWSHLKGLMRDALGDYLARSGTSGAEVQRRVTALFGGSDQAPGKIVGTSLYTDDRADLQPWSSTARETGSRVPKEDTLRTVEYVPAGHGFQSRLLLLDDALKGDFETALRRVPALGHRRSRGSGRILAGWNSTPAASRESLPVALRDESIPSGDAVLRLVLRNPDPLCLPVTGMPGNLIPTECYVRGQVLLGAFAAWAERAGKWDAMQLVLGRAVEFGNAYPLPTDAPALASVEQWDVLPFPLYLYRKKAIAAGPDWPWWAGAATVASASLDANTAIDRSKHAGGEKLKRPPESEFLFREKAGGPWRRYAPVISAHMRNRIPRGGEKQALFTTGEIAEETRFLCDIRLPAGEAKTFMTAFADLLAGRDWLLAGRGARPAEIEPESLCWMPDANVSLGTSSRVGLLLESDLVVRDEAGGFQLSLVPATVAELAGISLTDNDARTYSDWVEVHGYNAATGLPRSPVVAIRRGSVLIAEGKAASALKGLAGRGATWGERIWEGFGRHRLFDPDEFKPAGVGSETGAAATPTENRTEQILQMAEEMAGKTPLGKDAPSLSQWYALRAEVYAAETIEEVKKTIDRYKTNPRLGGQVWKGVLRGKVENDVRRFGELMDAKRYFDAIVRYLRLGSKPKEAK